VYHFVSFVLHSRWLTSRSELNQTLYSVAAVLASYAAAFWLITLPHHDLNFPMLWRAQFFSRIGYVSAVYCAIGVGVFFWAQILALAAKKRQWSRRDCQYAPLLTIIPGCVLFLAGGFTLGVLNLLICEAFFTRLRLSKLSYPNANDDSPFERDNPVTLFPR
jgi:hypothetical protein